MAVTPRSRGRIAAASLGGPAATTPARRGSTAAEVADAIARGRDERRRRAHEPHVRARSSGPTSSPASTRSSARCSSLILVVRVARGRAVRHRAGRRTRSSASCRSTGRSARSTGSRCSSAPTARVVRDGERRRDRGRARSCSTTSSSCAPATRSPADGVVRVGRRARARRVAAHRRVGSGRQGRRATRCSRAASSSPGPGGSRRRAVGADAYARKLATEARRFTLVRSELVDGINRILRVRAPGRSSRPPRCSRSASSARTTDWREAIAGRRRRRRRDGARRPRAADEPRVRGRGGHARPPPGARAGAAGGRGARARRRRAASTRPARSPRASIEFDRGRAARRPTTPVADGARRARGRRRTATRRWTRSRDAFPAPDGLGRAPASVPFSSARKWSAATFGEPRHLGARRAGDGVGRPARRRPGAAPGRRARGRAAGGCCCSRAPTRRSPARSCPTGSRPSALVLFEEKVRADAAETLAYFHAAGRRAAR